MNHSDSQSHFELERKTIIDSPIWTQNRPTLLFIQLDYKKKLDSFDTTFEIGLSKWNDDDYLNDLPRKYSNSFISQSNQ